MFWSLNVLKEISIRKKNWHSTTAAYIQLNLKDDFMCKFVYLYNYFILYFV